MPTENVQINPKKEYTAKCDLLKKNAKLAGVSENDFASQLKQMDRQMKEAAKTEKRYDEAMENISAVREAIDKLYDDVYEPEYTKAREDLETIRNGLKKAGKAYFTAEEGLWKQALIRVDDSGDLYLQERIRPAKDPRAEDLRSASQMLKERLAEFIPEEKPNFYKEAEEAPGLLNNVSRAIRASDESYSAKKQELIDKITALRGMVERGTIDKKEMDREVKALTPLLTGSIDPMSFVQDERLLQLPSQLAEVEERYFPAVKANEKEQKRYDKEMAVYDKKVAKGKSPEEVTPAQLINLDEIKSEMLEAMDAVTENLRTEIFALKEKNHDEAALEMLHHLEKQQLEKI